MNEWLRQFQSMEKPEQAIRAVVIGGTALLLLMAMVDVISGKREQAVAVAPRVESSMDDMAAAPDTDATTDAADEAAMADADAVEDAPEELAAEDSADLAADEIEDTVMAEADATEDMAAEEAADVAEDTVMAEAEATEDATEDMAAEEAADVAEDTVMAETDATEDATEDMTAEAATEAEDPAKTEADAGDAARDDSGVSALLASADPANGQRVFRQCGACHVYDAEQNRGGPHLVNIVGREVGVAEGWRYSRALSEHGGVWSVESLLAWLENPDSYIPGNQMAFRGLRNEQDRIDVLGFLEANRAD